MDARERRGTPPDRAVSTGGAAETAGTGGIGPVEEEPPAGAPRPGGDDQLWSAAGGPRPAEWWAGLPRGRRRWISAAATVAVLGGAVGYGLATRPVPPPPEPVPPPTWVTTVTYDGLDGPVTPGSRSFAVRMRITVSGREPVTVTSVTQGYAGLSTATVPRTPITVRPGTSRNLSMITTVRDCAKTPLAAGMPLINITLRNTRAIRTRSEIFGDTYARALSSMLRSLCLSGVKAATQLSPR